MARRPSIRRPRRPRPGETRGKRRYPLACACGTPNTNDLPTCQGCGRRIR